MRGLLLSLCLVLTLGAANAQAVTLNVLEWEGYIGPYAAGFEQYAAEKGVNVKLNILTPYISNPEQIFEAVRKKTADVVTPTHNYYKMSNDKLMQVLAPIDVAKLENYANVLGSLRAASYDQMDGKKHSVPLLGGSYGLAYNVDKTAEPTSWEALWDAANKGSYTITSDQFEANVYLCMLLAGVAPTSFYDIDSFDFAAAKPKIQERLNTLVANTHSFWPGMAQPAVMKDLKFTTTYWFGVAAANAEGQHWELSNPSEGQTVWLDTMAISGHVAGDPEKLAAAYLLLDYMISPEVQKKIHEDYGSIIVNAKAAELMTPEAVAAGRIGDETFFKEEFFWRPLSARTRNTYKTMWDEAVAKAGK